MRAIALGRLIAVGLLTKRGLPNRADSGDIHEDMKAWLVSPRIGR